VKVTVLGAGAWGTALARLLSDGKNDVTLWGHNAAHLEDLLKNGRNDRYLPGIALPPEMKLETDLLKSVTDAEYVVVAVPSKGFRTVTKSLAGFSGTAISVTKGLEHETGLTMCGILTQNAPAARYAALSGPSLALEMALFHRPTFRVYTSNDLTGVELGGALKNVIAIAAGVCDGLGFGDNSKAALVTRGLAEIRRLGVACGAQPDTFPGLSGLGALMVTCFSRLSRNRGFGERLGRGEKTEAILATSVSIAEGYPTAKSAHALARKLKIETPIIDEIYAALYESKHPAKALQDLTARESKAED
jgi:glycerol-3-phosphate dehydrogenase (NAD(P)+)